MTDTANTFAVGDRVRVVNQIAGRFGQVGVLSDINDKGPTLSYCNVVTFDDGRGGHYTADELERIDEEADPAAVSAGIPGSSANDGSGAGTTAEPPAEEPSVPSLQDLAAQVAALTKRLEIVEALLKFQTTFNRECGFSFEALHHRIVELSPRVDGTFRRLDGAPRTTHRLHTKIVKNTKGYGFELSAEATSDDPAKDVTLLVQDLLDCADKQARQHIIDAEYRDLHGLPGDDEPDPDQPF